MGKKFIRMIVAIGGFLGGVCIGYVIFFLATASLDSIDSKVVTASKFAVPVFFGCLFGSLSYIVQPRLSDDWNQLANRLEQNIKNTPFSKIAAGFVGLVVGLIIALLISSLYESITMTGLRVALTGLTFLAFGTSMAFLGARIVGNRVKDGEESRNRFFQAIAGRRISKGSTDAVPKILDTSVIIDGRILDLMKTGIVEGQIIIPEYVLTELRHLSDSADARKRAKGRRGLSILKDIQAYYGIEIYNTYNDADWERVQEVDLKLLRLADKLGGKVVTNDFNLIQVAEIQEIPVLNINDVVSALRTVVIPGEILPIHVAREGRESDQGVGYLDDGTMIVIEGGHDFINRKIDVEISSVLQTASGRMIFAKPAHQGEAAPNS